MELAIADDLQTLAFPSISTGIYGYPIEQAAPLAVETVRAALQGTHGIREVIFCCFSAGDLRVYQAALAAPRPAV
jgi:O-acetyl-ADP-ribose deacetylase (regulator of RNase III)